MKVIRNILPVQHLETLHQIKKNYDYCRDMAYQEESLRIGRRTLPWLGSGSFATVYALDDKTAVRIEGRKYQTNAFADYARLCCEVRNLHVPKISYLGITQHGVPLTIFERLEKVSADDPDWNTDWDNVGEYIERVLNGSWDADDLPRAPGLRIERRSIQRLAKQFMKRGYQADDIHSGNIMKRKGCNTLVVTDPFYWEEGFS